jgi:hypothetical protein
VFGLWLEGGVGDDAVLDGFAEKSVGGYAVVLTGQVVQCNVERSDRVHDRASSPVHRGADVEPFPQLLDVEWVLADQHVGEASAHAVGAGSGDACLGDPGVDVRFTDAD